MTTTEKPVKLCVSIVTPSLNQGIYIEDAIRSVQRQDGVSWEHIVIDGGSTDSTLSILSRYAHLKWCSESDRGQSDALNKGFQRASGDIVGWLNADDIYLPNALSRVVSFLEIHPEVDVMYGDYYWTDAAGRITQRRRELPFSRFMLRYLHVLYIPTVATWFRRRIFDEANFLDLTYHLAMDYEFFMRLMLKGYRFAHVPHFLGAFRWHEKQKSTFSRTLQKKELKRAAFVHNRLLCSIQSRLVQECVYCALQVSARGFRVMQKTLHGCYFDQFPGGSSDPQ